jgi:predicted RNA binding protein YcfA (HicA-like mRNA interferase family)
LKVRDVLALLTADGWYFERQRGSHRQRRHPRKPGTVTLSGKPGDGLHPKTLASILRQARLER